MVVEARVDNAIFVAAIAAFDPFVALVDVCFVVVIFLFLIKSRSE